MATPLERSWYRPHGWSLLFAPLSGLYGIVVWLRQLAYRLGWLQSTRLPVPVIVVGNITVGGSGKTPLTAHVAEYLHQHGLKVGIVSRGYGGSASSYPLLVEPEETPASAAGDEPVLLAARRDAVVVVDPDRPRGAKRLVEKHDADILIADDGLQHYALARDIEIEIVDAARGYGNGWLLPAGPLRESKKRARQADLQLVHGADDDFWLAPSQLRPVRHEAGGKTEKPCELDTLAGQRVHAVAGIGSPARFFDMLKSHGLDVIEHAFGDHHAYSPHDIRFDDDRLVLMTEKDAVKCREWADTPHWYVPVTARFSRAGQQKLEALLVPWVQ